MKKYLGKTKNGCDVFVDMETSHAGTHFADTPKLLEAVRRVIPTIAATDKHVKVEIATGEEVGTTDLVKTDEHDEIVYALRSRRTQYSRFAKNRKLALEHVPKPYRNPKRRGIRGKNGEDERGVLGHSDRGRTAFDRIPRFDDAKQVSTLCRGRVFGHALASWITLDLRKTDDGEYDLYTAYVGRLTPSFPGGNYLPEESKEFWAHHALVWGTQEIVPGTETTECPW